MDSTQDRLNLRTYVQDGHLLWGGCLDRKGYGHIKVGGKLRLTHRVMWETTYGPIPDGAHVLHTCDIPPCIEAKHLYLGIPTDNMQDRLRAGRNPNVNKVQCRRGHLYDEGNTYYRPDGGRKCRACNKEGLRQRHAK